MLKILWDAHSDQATGLMSYEGFEAIYKMAEAGVSEDDIWGAF
jgi:hypothetical protein